VRNEHSWLESVRAHWDRNRNLYRASWDTDGFSHRLHTIVYGRKTFDAEVMLNRYRRHNAEVMEYFRDRPGDLLVMDATKRRTIGQPSNIWQWEQLCGFLGQPIPDVDYPWENETTKDKETGL